MNAQEALVYCLGYVSDLPIDREYYSNTVWDRNNDQHWIAWRIEPALVDRAGRIPRLCSGSDLPFCTGYEPYYTSYQEK